MQIPADARQICYDVDAARGQFTRVSNPREHEQLRGVEGAPRNDDLSPRPELPSRARGSRGERRCVIQPGPGQGAHTHRPPTLDQDLARQVVRGQVQPVGVLGGDGQKSLATSIAYAVPHRDRYEGQALVVIGGVRGVGVPGQGNLFRDGE